jgi:hypothetical protein
MRDITFRGGEPDGSAANDPPRSNVEFRFRAHCDRARQVLYVRRDEITAAYTVRDDLLTALNESGGTADVYALAHRCDVSPTTALVHLALLQEQGVVYVTAAGNVLYLTLPGYQLARRLSMPSSRKGPAAPRAFSSHVPAEENPNLGSLRGEVVHHA